MIELSEAAVAVILGEARRSHDGRETGGIVLGHDHPEGDVLVTVAGDPGPRATRRPVWFRRDLSHAQELADAAYEADGSVWIGEWHTHLKGPPTPSRYDLRIYRSLLQDAELSFERLISLIVTAPSGDWSQTEIHGWVVTREEKWSARRLVVTAVDVRSLDNQR